MIKETDENSKIFSYVAVIFILLFSGSGVQVISPRILSYLLIAGTALLILYFFAQKRISTSIIAPIIFIVGIFFSMLASNDMSKVDSYVVLSCIVICGYILSICKIQRQILSTYSNVIYLIAIISIIGYVLVNSGIGLPLERVRINDSGLYKYHTIYIFNYIEEIPERNCGAFWEPGIFASHLILSMQYEIFSRRKKISRLLIETIAIITCNSSAGFFLLIIVFAELLVSTKSNEKNKAIKTIIGVVVLLILFAIILNIDTVIHYLKLEDNQYMKKLLLDNIQSSTRFLSLSYNWKMFLHSPIFGNGLTNAVKNIPLRNLTPDTTTSLFMLNAFGIVGVLFSVLAIKGIIRLKFMAWYERILMLTVVLIILNKETHYIMLSSWFMIFSFSFGRNWKYESPSFEDGGRMLCF